MENYKLVVFLNLLNLIPDGVYPVFQGNDGKYYGGFVKSQKELSVNIEQFIEWREDVIERIVFFDDIKNNPDYSIKQEEVQDEYKLGDMGLSVHQISEKEIYVGRADKFLEFLKEHTNSIEEVLNSGDEKKINEMLKYYNSSLDSIKIYLYSLNRDIEDLSERFERLRGNSK